MGAALLERDALPEVDRSGDELCDAALVLDADELTDTGVVDGCSADPVVPEAAAGTFESPEEANTRTVRISSNNRASTDAKSTTRRRQ